MTARGAGPGRGKRIGRLLASGALAAACLGWAGPRAAAPTDLDAPSEPEALTGTAISDTEIGLDWDPPRIALGLRQYIVYRDGVVVATVAAPTTTYVDVGLQPSTNYQYRVSAVDVLGEGPKSKPVTVKTLRPADTSPPTAPMSLQASAIAPDRVDLAWQPASDPESGVSHYRVYRNGSLLTTTSNTSFSDGGVQPQTTYTYAVSAVNGDGLEGPKASASATTPAQVDTSPPTAPASLQASAVAPDRIDLAWQPASDPESGVSQYRVYRNGSLLATTSNTSFSDGGVQPQTTYTYEVSALNGDGLEGPKASASATTPAASDTSPPSVPGNLQATPVTPRQIDLSWQAASDPESGIAVYRVYRDGALLTSTSARAYSDAGLEPETTYSYRVSAVNRDGLEGARTPTVSVTTPAAVDTTPPAPPGRPRIIG